MATEKKTSSSTQADNKQISDFLARFSQATLNSSSHQSSPLVVGGKEMLFYGITAEDRDLWNGLIDYGDDVSIQNVIQAGKAYLLTRVIGNPSDPHAQLLKHNEAHYGNIFLHNRMVQSHDETILSAKKLDAASAKLLNQNQKGADYLLRYYELKQKLLRYYELEQKNARSASIQIAAEKRAEIRKAISAKDVEGKTPLLLACKNVNQQYALRLINLDEQKETIQVADTVENRTPLHIACILGLKDLANKLIELGANKDAIDKFGHTPFHYLTGSDGEQAGIIKTVLDSVNFFYGRYFNASDITLVTNELITRNNALKNDFAHFIQTQGTAEKESDVQKLSMG